MTTFMKLPTQVPKAKMNAAVTRCGIQMWIQERRDGEGHRAGRAFEIGQISVRALVGTSWFFRLFIVIVCLFVVIFRGSFPGSRHVKFADLLFGDAQHPSAALEEQFAASELGEAVFKSDFAIFDSIDDGLQLGDGLLVAERFRRGAFRSAGG